MPEYTLIVPPDWDGQALRKIAMEALGLSSGQFKRAKYHGQMLADGAPILANQRLNAGQKLVLRIPEKENTLPSPGGQSLSVLYEDDLFLIADKPAPLPSASSWRQEGETMENQVYAYLGCPSPFVYRPVNRLDKGTSGLMLVAKTAHGQYLLQQQLHTPAFVREYLAVVEGAPPEEEGCIDLPIRKAEGATVRREIHPQGKEARTFYQVLERHGSRSLLLLRLDTGRTHQIRVHLSAVGCPVAGDFLYGEELAQLPGRFALHSFRCSLLHPLTAERIVRESPLPPALAALLQSPPPAILSNRASGNIS